MKLPWLALVLLSVAASAFLFAACSSSASSRNVNLTTAQDGIPRISVADAKLALDKGEAIIIDTRSAVDYKQEHIKGSINLPLAEAGARAKELPKNKLLIAYCS